MLGPSQARSGVLNTRDYGERGDARWASTIEILQRLRKAGVKLAIDELGTDYSSLSQLKRMPVDELKTDRPFVLGLAKGGEDAVIVKSIIELGHNVVLRLVADGVEDERSWGTAESQPVRYGTGFFISKSLPSDELIPGLERFNSSSPAWNENSGSPLDREVV